MKLFEYAVIYIPSDSETKKGKEATLIVPVSTVLASNEKQATLLAGRKIPTEYLSKLDRVEVAVRPF